MIELIKALDLPLDFADTLNPFVQEKYKQLWEDAHPPAKRYVTLWRNKWLTAEAESLEDMIEGLQSAADTLRSMLADGVTLDPEGGTSDDYAYLVTTDPVIAKKYDMHDEKEFWGDDEENEEQQVDESKIHEHPPGSSAGSAESSAIGVPEAKGISSRAKLPLAAPPPRSSKL